MCRTCGASPPAPCASSAARWRTPKRCCSSTTASARSRNSTGRLDQRVRADDQRQLAASPSRAEELAPPRRRGRPGQQRDRDEAAEQPVERGHVLLGERLGRRHQRRLAPASARAQHRVQRDDASCPSPPRPSAAAASAARARCRASIALEAALLVAGQLERQRRQPAGRPARRAVDGGRAQPRLLARALARGQRQLEQQQLLEREPRARAAASSSASGKWIARERGGTVGQPLGDAQRRAAAARRRRARSARALHDAAREICRREPLGGGIDRHEPDRCTAAAASSATSCSRPWNWLRGVALARGAARACPPAAGRRATAG